MGKHEPHPLRVFRENRKPPLTQGQLAELCGVTRVTVSRWETGSKKMAEGLVPTVSKRTGIPRDKLRPDLAHLMRSRRSPHERATS